MSIDPIDAIDGPSPIDAPRIIEAALPLEQVQPAPPVEPMQRDHRAEALNIAQHGTAFIPSPYLLTANEIARRRRR